MLLQQTIGNLHEMKLTGMAHALEEQQGLPDIQDLSFEKTGSLYCWSARAQHAPIAVSNDSCNLPGYGFRHQ